MDKLTKQNNLFRIDNLTKQKNLFTRELTDKTTKVVGKIVSTADTSAHFVTNNLFKYMPTFIVAALMLLVANVWNTYFQSLIDSYFPATLVDKYNAWLKILYSLVLSIIIVILIAIITYYLPEPPKKS